MKSMTRKELADRAGVTTTTLRNWMKPHMKKLIDSLQFTDDDIMKSMTRKELADRAGVTTTTLRNWMKPHMKKLIG